MQFKRERWMLATALILIPFIQLGASFYWSVQMVIFVLLISFLSFKELSKNIFYGGGLLLLVFMGTSLFFQENQDLNQSVLLTVRIFLCFIVLLTCLSQKHINEKFNSLIELIIASIAFGIFVFAIMQKQSFSAGSLLYIPRELYIANEGTLGDELSVYFNTVRPSATFAEPSYFGFIALSLYVLTLVKFTKKWLKLATTMALWGGVLVCATLSGVISLFIITILYYAKKGLDLKLLILFLLLLLVSLILFDHNFYSILSVLEARVSNIGSGQLDASAESRILKPFVLIRYIFENHPLGLTTDVLIKKLGLDAVIGTDNGFLLLFVNFGLTAFYLYWLIFLKLVRRPILAVYLLMASMFNGSIFSFDKVTVMGLVVLLIGREMVGPLRTKTALTLRRFDEKPV